MSKFDQKTLVYNLKQLMDSDQTWYISFLGQLKDLIRTFFQGHNMKYM